MKKRSLKNAYFERSQSACVAQKQKWLPIDPRIDFQKVLYCRRVGRGKPTPCKTSLKLQEHLVFDRTLWNNSIKLFCQTSELCAKSLYKRKTKTFQVNQCSVKEIFAKKIFDFRFDELSAPFVKKTNLFIGPNFLTTKNGLWVSSKNRSSSDLFAPFISSFKFSSQSLVTVKISWLVFKTLLSFVIHLDMLVNFAFSSLLKEFLQKILRFLEHELKVLRYQLLIGCMVSMKLSSSFLFIFQLEIRLWAPIVLLFL